MLSEVQEKILGFIRHYLDSNQIPPTLREIQDHCRFSAIGTVQYHLKQLSEAGYLALKPRLSRGIQLTHRAAGIPIIGRVPAGPAQLAFEQVEGYLSSLHESARTVDARPASRQAGPAPIAAPVPAEARGLFALRVKGDSMVGAGILDGDLVIVRPQASAKNGDIVVARLDQEEATVKRLIRKPGVIHLAPENPRYKAIPVDDNTQIIGKVIRVVRHYNG
ncbi:MAG: LexA family transcriptional regulator [Elusimicrobiota bacterium]|jgi:repressor LexA